MKRKQKNKRRNIETDEMNKTEEMNKTMKEERK